MISKELIEKLAGTLKKGDQVKIASMAGVAKITVNRFLKGDEKCVSDETAALIIESIEVVVKERNKLIAASERKIKSITKTA